MLAPIEGRLRRADLANSELVLRGTPVTVAALLDQAEKMAKLYSFRGEALYAVSAAATAPGTTLDDLLTGSSLRTRHSYTTARVSAVVSAGFEVLPTFGAPHVSIAWPRYHADVAQRLQEVLGPLIRNPHFEGRFR